MSRPNVGVGMPERMGYVNVVTVYEIKSLILVKLQGTNGFNASLKGKAFQGKSSEIFFYLSFSP